jgi:large conductance mechanosensitive channel
MGVVADFKAFLTQSNFVTLAVAFVVGAQVTLVVTALVTGIVDPAIAVFFNTNFASIGRVTVNGSTFMFGLLLAAAINFAIVLLVVFFGFVYPLARYEAKKAARAAAAPPTTKTCPQCFSTINILATQCAFCGEMVPASPPATPPATASALTST